MKLKTTKGGEMNTTGSFTGRNLLFANLSQLHRLRLVSNSRCQAGLTFLAAYICLSEIAFARVSEG